MTTRKPPGPPPDGRGRTGIPWRERGAPGRERAAELGAAPPRAIAKDHPGRHDPGVRRERPAPRPQAAPHWDRLREIGVVFARHGLGALADRLGLTRGREWRDWVRRLPARFGGRPVPVRHWPDAVREAFVELGPAFVKAGQILSVRPDLVPEELADALRSLQSDVPPEPFEAVRQVVEAELGRPLEVAFKRFEHAPIAAASIAQVHRAELPDGTCVAVKVKRRGIDPVVTRDLEILLWLAAKAERDWPAARPYRPVEATEELVEYTRRELDFRREARVADRLGQHFRDWPTVMIPAIHFASRDLLVMDFVTGEPIDRWALEADEASRQRMLRTTVSCFNEQILALGLFHADPHPGNLHVTPDGYLAILDFGIFGEIDEPRRRTLALSQIAMARGEFGSSVRILLRLADIEPDGDPCAYQREVAGYYRLWQRANVAEYGFGRLVLDVVGAGARHGVIFPPEVILYGKCMATLEGVASMVVPDTNLAEAAEGCMERLADDLMGGPAVARALRRAMPVLVDLAERLPIDGAGRLLRELEDRPMGREVAREPGRDAGRPADGGNGDRGPAIATMASGVALALGGVGPVWQEVPVLGTGVLALGLIWAWRTRTK